MWLILDLNNNTLTTGTGYMILQSIQDYDFGSDFAG
jgi:hypothetical protein